MTVRRVAVLLVLFALLAPAVSAQTAPRFAIESIRVEGTRFTSPRILIAESRLVAGHEYSEVELRDAVARVNRLPFVLHTDFRLEKGSTRGLYVLVMSIVEAKPLFLSFQSAHETVATVKLLAATYDPETGEVHTEFAPVLVRRNEELVTIGGRWFVGSSGVLHLSADRGASRRYSLGFTQYDLLGTRASLSIVAQYRDVEVASAYARNLKAADHLAFEVSAAVPLSGNHALRATWFRQSNPYVAGERLRVFGDARGELSWIYDTTNDQLFPTRGRALKAGLQSKELRFAAGETFKARWSYDGAASLARYWELSPRQSVSARLSGNSVADREYREYQLGAGYSASLWDRDRTIRLGDLRLEVEAQRNFLRYSENTSYGTVRAGVAARNPWGVVRLDFRYIGWRHGTP